MDTNRLVLGQDVYIITDVDIHRGKVLKVTPEGVDVESERYGVVLSTGGCLLQFDNDGKCRKYGNSSWKLDDMPFAERTAELELEKKARRAGKPFVKKLVVGQEVWMQSGWYVEKGTVKATVSNPPDTVIENRGVTIYMPEWYVEVETGGHCIIRFDANGQTGDGWHGLGLWESFGQSDPRTPGTEYGPWELVEAPSEEKVKERDPKNVDRFLGTLKNS
jgi:hypothetical protein